MCSGERPIGAAKRHTDQSHRLSNRLRGPFPSDAAPPPPPKRHHMASPGGRGAVRGTTREGGVRPTAVRKGPEGFGGGTARVGGGGGGARERPLL